MQIHGADFDQSRYQYQPGDLPTNKCTEVYTLDLAANEQPTDKIADEAEADSQQPKLTQLESTIKHPWVLGNSPYNFYRSETIFQVPAHLKLEQISQVLLARQGAVSLTTGEQADRPVPEADFTNASLQALSYFPARCTITRRASLQPVDVQDPNYDLNC